MAVFMELIDHLKERASDIKQLTVDTGPNGYYIKDNNGFLFEGKYYEVSAAITGYKAGRSWMRNNIQGDTKT